MIAVLGPNVETSERDRLLELVSQSRNLPLVIITLSQLGDGFIAELGKVAELRLHATPEALRNTDLAAVLNLPSPNEMKSAARALTARRLLLAAQALMLREQRRCEANALRLRPVSIARPLGEDALAKLAAEGSALKSALSAAFEKNFKAAAEAFKLADLIDGDVIVSRDGHSGDVTYTASDQWITSVKTQVRAVATPVLEDALRFANLRIRALGEHVRSFANAMELEQPGPVPTLDREEFSVIVAKEIGAIKVGIEAAKERKFSELIGRHNPLGIIQPLLPLFGLAVYVFPEKILDKGDASTYRRNIAAIVMGVGALFYLISIIRALPQRRTILERDRDEARRRLTEKTSIAIRDALIRMASQTSGQVARRTETVNNWFSHATRGGGQRQSALSSQDTMRDNMLKLQHRNLAGRLRTIADALKSAP